MMILGLLLCFGGGWIIQDDVNSRHQLRKVTSGLTSDNGESIYFINQLFVKPCFTSSWRLHYEAEIHDGVDNTGLAEQIPGYYSIFSDQNQWINYGCVSLGRTDQIKPSRFIELFVSVIGCINIMISLVMLCTRPDDCLYCMILNYCIILTIGMSLSAGASIITYLRYEEALSLQAEIIYHYMTLYFMGLGFLFALLIAVLLGISWGSFRIRSQKNGFKFQNLPEP